MKNKEIRYSVIMPVYNGRKYFEDALKSAIRSLGASDEIIVVEDGSTDGGVADIVFDQNDPRVSYKKKDNGGVASALNYGIRVAKNPYFSWLSHDDIYLPERLEEDRRLRRVCPDIVTFSSFYLFNDGLEIAHLINQVKIATSRHFATRLLSRRFLNGCTVTAPVSILIKCGLFDEDLRHTQDYDMWLKITEFQKFSYIERPLLLSRQHPLQDSKKLPDEAKREFLKILKRHIKKVRINRTTILDIMILLVGVFR